MFGLWKTWKALEARGIMGINRRNADYVLKYNKRSLYPIVDDKIITKERAIAAGIHVPELYGVISTEKEIDNLDEIIGGRTDFVIKPARAPAATASLWLPTGSRGAIAQCPARSSSMRNSSTISRASSPACIPGRAPRPCVDRIPRDPGPDLQKHQL